MDFLIALISAVIGGLTTSVIDRAARKPESKQAINKLQRQVIQLEVAYQQLEIRCRRLEEELEICWAQRDQLEEFCRHE